MQKKERMLRVLCGEQVDYVPSSYWFHFSHITDVKEKAQAHLDFHHATDMDFLKVMYEYPYSLDLKIEIPSDWRKLVPLGRKSPEYQKQTELIRRIQDGLGENTMVFTTVFGAFKMAQWLVGEERLMEHLREEPQSVMVGTKILAEMLADWVDGFIDLGIDGVMYAAQYGERTRFSKSFWEIAVKPCDDVVLRRVRERNRWILLHMCGMAQYGKNADIQRFVDYPMDLASWAVHSTGISLREGQKLFRCPVLGGMDNCGALTGHNLSEIRNEVHHVIQETGKNGLIMGADCVILEHPCVENVRAAVEAAREFS